MIFGYCNKCKNKGMIMPDYYDEAIEELEGFNKYCNGKHCKHGKNLKFKNDHPILNDIKNNNVVKYLTGKFWMLTSSWFWSDVKYLTRKIVRFPLRIYEWSSVLFHDDEYGSEAIMKLIEFKLLKYEKALRKDEWYLTSDERADQIKAALVHLDAYRDIEKYTKSPAEHNTWFEPCEDRTGFSRMCSDETPEDRELRRNQMELEEWHHDMFWVLWTQHYRGWSC